MSGGYSQRMMIIVRKMIDDTLARWNPFTNDTTLSVPRSALPPPEDSPYAAAESAYDAHFLWGLPLAQSVPVEGDAYLWNAANGKFTLGAAAGGGDGGKGAGFRASLPAQQIITADFSKIQLTNEIHDLGDCYIAASAAWNPPAGPVAFVYRVVTTDNQDGDPQVQIRRNGVAVYERFGGRYSRYGYGWSESAFIDIASEGDSYELHVSLENATLTTDTFWAGMVAVGSGGTDTGSGGGGGVPAPYAYLIDSDGAYLLDADGVYLHEGLI